MSKQATGSGNTHPGAYGSASLSENHRRFFEAAEPLFSRFGYKKTTVEDVCRAAGKSKRTFYDLFNDKQDLLLQLAESVINTATSEWESSLPEDLDPLGQMHSFLDFYASMVGEHPFMRVFVEDIEIMRLFAAETEELRVAQTGGALEEILRAGIAAGQFKPLESRAAVWLVFGILDTSYLLMPAMMGTPSPLDDPDLAHEIRSFIVRGLGVVNEGANE